MTNKERNRKWYLDNKEKKSIDNKQWHINNRIEALENMKQYFIINKEKRTEYKKQWRKDNPDKERNIERKSRNKRKRNLGFFPLNKYFENSHAHHISQNFVIYIPEEIHRSIWHCLVTGYNMDEINKLAINFL